MADEQHAEGTTHLHPQNDRVPDRGLERFEAHYRLPPVWIVNGEETQHESPLCPEVRGKPHRAWCREEALFAFGESWCEVCRRV